MFPTQITFRILGCGVGPEFELRTMGRQKQKEKGDKYWTAIGCQVPLHFYSRLLRLARELSFHVRESPPFSDSQTLAWIFLYIEVIFLNLEVYYILKVPMGLRPLLFYYLLL